MPAEPEPADLPALLRAALGAGLPGEAAHRALTPPHRLREAHPSAGAAWREASVLLLLHPGPRGPGFPLIIRSRERGSHRGQVSLPGGSIEAGESPEEAALREAREEIGVDPDSVELLGGLSPLLVPPSGFRVRPFVAWTAARPDFRLDPAEAEGLVEARLDELLDPASRIEVRREGPSGGFLAPAFRLGGAEVWGATAMVLAELAALLSGLPPEGRRRG